MGYQRVRESHRAVWALARRHGVVARWQLLDLGFHPQAIKHRIAKGRLHPVYRGIYAVGRPQLSEKGRWMAAILACRLRSCCRCSANPGHPSPPHPERKGRPGVRPLRSLLDRHTFRLTDSELERRFLCIVREAGLPLPKTQAKLGGRTDFHWASLGLVVETAGLRYHRTPSGRPATTAHAGARGSRPNRGAIPPLRDPL
jgi:hypothetical protein